MHSIRRKLLITLIGALLAAGFTTAAARLPIPIT